MSRKKKWRWSGDNKGGLTVSSRNSRNRVTPSEVVWGQQWNSKECSRPFQVWQMGLCIFHAAENLWLKFGWLSSSAWGPWAECILHTTAESHDVWPLCHGKLPSKGKKKGRKREECECVSVWLRLCRKERDAQMRVSVYICSLSVTWICQEHIKLHSPDL